MSGDSKIGPLVGGAMRTVTVRKIGAGSSAGVRGAAPLAASGPVAAARLVGLTQALAAQSPPVDVERVASLRIAIASGNYAPDAGATAGAMLAFYQGSADA